MPKAALTGKWKAVEETAAAAQRAAEQAHVQAQSAIEELKTATLESLISGLRGMAWPRPKPYRMACDL